MKLALDSFIRKGLGALKEPRKVVEDLEARYFGARLGERDIAPDSDARLGQRRFEEWLAQREF